MISYKKLLLVSSIISMMPLISYASDEKESTTKATESASKWLSYVDSGMYGQSWDQAALYFRAAVKKDQWESQIKSVRCPLGKVIKRKLKDSKFATQLPGAPDGEYVVIQYDTSFEGKKEAVETVTPMKQKNGYWRVSGYFIK